MPRYARPHVTGGLFHVISRFRDGEFFLNLDGARAEYLRLLGNAAGRSTTRVIAYCLMSSHVHLVLQLGADPLGRFTKSVHSGFARWVNEHRRGLGPIFADRPRSLLVHAETHGLELVRYVHNNPVRAGVVERAIDSGWSSHRAYVGLDTAPPWLAVDALLGPDGAGREGREEMRRALARLVDEGRHEPRRPELSGEVTHALSRRIRSTMGAGVELCYPVLGPDDFVRDALVEQVRRHGQRSTVPAALGARGVVTAIFGELGVDASLADTRRRGIDLARARALTAWVWVEALGRPQAEIGAALGLGSSAVSQMISKLRARGIGEEERALVGQVIGTLSVVAAVDEDGAGEVGANVPSPRVFVVKRERR
jgi:REP element-mobilizing transposase RayT